LVFEKCKDRNNNDKNNNIRENILLNINDKIFCQDYFKDKIYGEKWTNIKNKWNNFLYSLMGQKVYDKITISKKGGRIFNFDFELKYIFKNKIINTFNIEFKFNSKSIESLPQILNLPESADILRGNSYGKFFYQNYLNSILKIRSLYFTDIKINETEYLKNVYQNNYNKHPLFLKLKVLEQVDEDFKNKKKIIVDNSIKEFLNKFYREINLEKILNLMIIQDQKLFALWDCEVENFKLQKIFTQGDIVCCGIKNNNTIVIKIGTSYFDLLLRWKNHKGVLYPAWQIKKTNDNKKLCKK
jgi:hypothetical protein